MKEKVKKKRKVIKKGNTGKAGGQYGNKNADKWTEKKALELGQKLLDWLDKPAEYHRNYKTGERKLEEINLFVVEFFARQGLYKDIVYKLRNKFKSFGDLYAQAKLIQEYKLNRHGIIGDLNPIMSKFCLTNHHNYSERLENKENPEQFKQKQKNQNENTKEIIDLLREIGHEKSSGYQSTITMVENSETKTDTPGQ